jgi:PAS domain-containing protein
MPENATDFSINLRRQAEEKDLFLPLNAETLSPEQIRERLHELRMHQIELEMKNDELLKTHSDLEIERKRYCDLYDMAPVGYCTLNEKDVIVEANLTAATLFGVERKLLIRRKITL